MVAPGSSVSSNVSGSQGAQQNTSEQTSQGTSTSFIPNYSQTPILEQIAQTAAYAAPIVYDRGYDAYNANQGNINNMMAQAQQYASPANIQMQMGMAEAGAAQANESARQSTINDLQGYGINPSDGKYAELDQAARIQGAAQVAGAGNQQRLAVQQAGFGMENQALAASMSNAQNLNTLGQTYNQGLAVGMSLPYPSLGTASQQSMQQYGQGTQTSSSFGNQQSASQQYSPMQQAMGTLAAQGGANAYGQADQPKFTGVQVARGGYISPALSNSHGAEVDDVPARLNAGEYVIPRDVVDWMGKAHFAKLIQQARKARGDHSTDGQHQSTGYQDGGAIAAEDDAEVRQRQIHAQMAAKYGAIMPTRIASSTGWDAPREIRYNRSSGPYFAPDTSALYAATGYQAGGAVTAQAPPGTGAAALGGGSQWVPSSQAEGGGYYMPVAQAPPAPLGGAPGQGGGAGGGGGGGGGGGASSLIQQLQPDAPYGGTAKDYSKYFQGLVGKQQALLANAPANVARGPSYSPAYYDYVFGAANGGEVPASGYARGGRVRLPPPMQRPGPFSTLDIGQAFAQDRQAFGNQDLRAAIEGTGDGGGNVAGQYQPGGVEAQGQSFVQGNQPSGGYQYQGGGEVGCMQKDASGDLINPECLPDTFGRERSAGPAANPPGQAHGGLVRRYQDGGAVGDDSDLTGIDLTKLTRARKGQYGEGEQDYATGFARGGQVGARKWQ